ncbi:ribose transport protein RbsD [Halanaerobium saccharolyticum]|uniref:D-ribose pyranase n=1 Tax=Halanaerobium saccharolyticum TaxID=43595 RepID=A0A4R7Z6U5_9FIRM|nr:D-ribose pyranase [Halanaerobium saccharolyticum]RAK10610.1 ribose transport protein RbsD [Halanaerobium saccharolyticum]TDW06633.1 ribose transport protein RbsD [Halanaerobium saccharolyticum]TDX62268.1 ribose transport protein RbsD [Halanaerobium saccharolyticum]
MKRNGIINSQLTRVIAEMGHKDSLVIADCGLPIPQEVERIDLSLTKGYPEFLKILSATLDDLVVEKAILAAEIKEQSPELEEKILALLPDVEIEYLPHQAFKMETNSSRAVVRSGEIIPYANIILISGVDF